MQRRSGDVETMKAEKDELIKKNEEISKQLEVHVLPTFIFPERGQPQRLQSQHTSHTPLAPIPAPLPPRQTQSGPCHVDCLAAAHRGVRLAIQIQPKNLLSQALATHAGGDGEIGGHERWRRVGREGGGKRELEGRWGGEL